MTFAEASVVESSCTFYFALLIEVAANYSETCIIKCINLSFFSPKHNLLKFLSLAEGNTVLKA